MVSMTPLDTYLAQVRERLDKAKGKCISVLQIPMDPDAADFVQHSWPDISKLLEIVKIQAECLEQIKNRGCSLIDPCSACDAKEAQSECERILKGES